MRNEDWRTLLFDRCRSSDGGMREVGSSGWGRKLCL